MKETITVTYTATAELAPNRVRVDMTVVGEDKTPEQAGVLCHMNCDALKERMAGIDVKLAAGAMSVSRRYRDELVIAFRAVKAYSTEFDYEPQTLDGVIDALTALGVEWRLSYKLKNSGKEREKLVKQAIAGAKKAADVIAAAANVGLGKLVKVEYVSSDGGAMPVMLRAVRSMDTDAPPEPIRLSETVVCGWEID